VISIFSRSMVLSGAVILVFSLPTIYQIKSRMPNSPERTSWNIMLLLVATFIVGYLGYTLVFWHAHAQWLDLIVPTIFFFGACFVWLTAKLALKSGIALVRLAILEHENSVDSLTGVFNRRFLDRRLGEEIKRADRHSLPLSVLLLDVDHFKEINDRFGHQFGDTVLKYLVELIRRQLREPDILARYGGDEFMVIAPQTTINGAIELADRLRSHIESSGLKLPNEDSKISETSFTCSIGVVSLRNGIDCPIKLFQAVDENLYRSKRDGRNRVNADIPNIEKLQTAY